ncbi:MAG TPA: DegT/DnrJ/EryC1/StrS family aminotransferase [Bacillota bacterium]|nr:DegT/DnrJ/EryC1/StrS family aminotransferase [Bacillota bacterium]
MEFRDLKAQYLALQEKIDAKIKEVLCEGRFILGRQVFELEEKLAEYVGVKHCITCANGTDALLLVLMAWGIGPGDAAFTSDFTFIASASVASLRGATPVLVDIDPKTYNISPDALEEAIERTFREGKLTPRVIIPVDLFGLPADYPRIEKIAQKYNLLVLEDGAQGFGGSINGRKACSFGNAATTSFFPAKPLGCYGDGGAIFTDDDELAATLRSIRAHGRSPEDKYDNQTLGLNSRLDTLQAAILLTKLEAFIEYELDAVNRVADVYTENLSDIVQTPVVPEGYYSSWAQYTIRLDDKEERDTLQRKLAEQGIPSMVYYPRPLHSQTVFSFLGLDSGAYPNSARAAETVFSVPIHPYLSKADIERGAGEVKDFIAAFG